MGNVGVDFPITARLEQVWGFTPSRENMGRLLDLFAYDRTRVTDDLAELRLAAATRPGVHEAFAAMFAPPRQEPVSTKTRSPRYPTGHWSCTGATTA